MKLLATLLLIVCPALAEDKKELPSVKVDDIEIRLFEATLSAPGGRPAVRQLSLKFDVENKGTGTTQIPVKIVGVGKVTVTYADHSTKARDGTLRLHAPLSEKKDGVCFFKPTETGSMKFTGFVVSDNVQDEYTVSIPGAFIGKNETIELKIPKDAIKVEKP